MNWRKRVNRGLILSGVCTLAVIVYYTVNAIIAIPAGAQTNQLAKDYMEIYNRYALVPEEYRNFGVEPPVDMIQKQAAAYRAEVEKLFATGHPENKLERNIAELNERLRAQAQKDVLYASCSDYKLQNAGGFHEEIVRKDFTVGYLDISARQTREHLAETGADETEKWVQDFSFLFVRENGVYKILAVIRKSEYRTDNDGSGSPFNEPYYYDRYGDIYGYDYGGYDAYFDDGIPDGTNSFLDPGGASGAYDASGAGKGAFRWEPHCG